MPDDVRYHGSWVDTDFSRCFQVMEAPDQHSLDVWMAEWADLVEFECIPVYTSAEAAAIPRVQWRSFMRCSKASFSSGRRRGAVKVGIRWMILVVMALEVED